MSSPAASVRAATGAPPSPALLSRWATTWRKRDQRPDSEHEHGLIRIAIGIGLLIYGAVVSTFGVVPGGLGNPAFLAAPMIVIVGLITIVWILIDPAVNHTRRVIGIFFDVLTPTWAIHFAGPWGVSLGFVYLMSIIGTGFRYGPRYLVFTAVLCNIASAVNWWITPEIRAHPQILLLGIFALTVVPLYHASLLKRLRRAISQRQEAIGRAVHAEERERQRIAADLHDTIGQDLTAAANYASLVGQMMGSDQISSASRNRIATYAAEIHAISQRMHASVRGMLEHLWPEVLDELGLIDALNEMVDGLAEQRPDMQWAFAASCELEPDAARDICLYRIAQEATTNILRHANATHASVALLIAPSPYDEQAEDLILEVHDNGRGFRGTPQAGFGLGTMRERAKAIGGQLRIESRPTGGTVVCVKIPTARPEIDEQAQSVVPGRASR